MPAHKLIDWGEEEDYMLVAMHTTAAPYRLAYLINKYLKMQFFRTVHDQDVTMPNYIANYPVYKHEDLAQNVHYFLVPNKQIATALKASDTNDLFSNDIDQELKVTLIKEYSKVDYLLKICTEDAAYKVKELATLLLTIPQVISAYPVDHLIIKQQDYLIFE